MRFFLPALLQRFDCVDAQSRRCAQGLCLGDQSLATRQAFFLNSLQRRMRGVNGCLPQRMQFGVHLLAEVAAIAPALRKLMQLTGHIFPVGALAMRGGPSFDFFNQGQTLCFVRCCLGACFFEPNIHHLMRTGASGIKTLPQRRVGGCKFVDFFPLFTQMTQGFLHLAPAHGGYEFWLSSDFAGFIDVASL